MEAPLDPPPGSNNNNTMGNVYETEGGRGCRSKRKQTHPTFCPVCKCTLRPSDVDQHLNCELEKLQKISKSRSNRILSNGALVPASSGSSSSSSSSSGSGSHNPSPSSSGQIGASLPGFELYRKYQQVRNNRQSRQKAKSKRRKLNDGSSTSANTDNSAMPGPSSAASIDGARDDEYQCPICNSLTSHGKILTHVERCLARSERRLNKERRAALAGENRPSSSTQPDGDESSIDESSTDEEGDGEPGDSDLIDVEGYEEYEWAGQSRVRLTSLVEGKIGSLIPSAQANVMADDVDEDLIVDDVDQYGPPQYTERDMIYGYSDSEHREEATLRRAVLSPIMRIPAAPAQQPTVMHRSKSAEPQRAGEMEALNKRTNSDPLPVTNNDLAQATTAEGFHSYPLQRSSPLPILMPADAIGHPVRTLSDSSRSSSPLPPFLTTASFWDLRPSVTMEDMARGASTSLSGIPAHLLMEGVPRLSAIAQDAADRAHYAGANPPSTYTKQGGDAINHLIIESLLAKIRELEKKVEGDVHKCLICMDRYRKPVISTTCWHVHCEECWLRTLGAKKLCPQCNTITTPNDLRKIFI